MIDKGSTYKNTAENKKGGKLKLLANTIAFFSTRKKLSLFNHYFSPNNYKSCIQVLYSRN